MLENGVPSGEIGTQFYQEWIGVVASHCFLHSTLFLASKQTLKNWKHPRGPNVEMRRIDLTNWALWTSQKFTTGLNISSIRDFVHIRDPEIPIILHPLSPLQARKAQDMDTKVHIFTAMMLGKVWWLTIYTHGKAQVLILQGAVWTPGLVWTWRNEEKSAPRRHLGSNQGIQPVAKCLVTWAIWHTHTHIQTFRVLLGEPSRARL